MSRIATGDAQARLRQMVESRLTGVSASDRPAALEQIAREAKALGVEPAVLDRIVDAFDRGRELERGAELAAFAQHGPTDVQRSRPFSGSPQWLVKGGVEIPSPESKQVAATGVSAVKEVEVDDFQRLTGLVVLDCGSAPGVVDSGDNIYETGSAGLQLVPHSEAMQRYEAAIGGPGSSAKVEHDPAAPLCNDQLLYCLNKSPQRVEQDIARRIEAYDVVIGTKANQEQYERLRASDALRGMNVSFDEISQVLTIRRGPPQRLGSVLVVATAAADQAVAEEAARVAEGMGNRVERLYTFEPGAEDVRSRRREIEEANTVIVVSGGGVDLTNSIAAQTSRPVIAVPTSNGFGEGLDGVAHLMGAMTEWAPGVSAVNIDNGFGAAYVADKINREALQGPGHQPSAGDGKAGKGMVVVTTAGSADISVAERAAADLEKLGDKVVRYYDNGVNDPEAVERGRKLFEEAAVVVVAAGLEGGLPNAVAAMTQKPIVAVPTEVGYGTGRGGVAALMSALNACSPGILTVKISAGADAARVAHKINELASASREHEGAQP